MTTGRADQTEGGRGPQRRLGEGGAIWAFPEMAVSRRRAMETSTLTITITACSVSKKPGAVHVNIKGESYRLREKKKAGLLGRQRRPAEGADEPKEVGAEA